MIMSSDQDAKLISLAKQALDEDVSELGEDIHLRLAAARRAAVAEMDRPVLFLKGPWLTTAPAAAGMPATAMAATAMAASLVLAVGIWSMRSTVPELPVYGGEDAQLAAQNMDLLSDMEFVAWLVLEEEPNAG